MNVRLMSDLDLQGKTVVFREDLNVPVKEAHPGGHSVLEVRAG